MATAATFGKPGFLFLPALLFADNVERFVGERGADGNKARQAPALVSVLDQLSNHERRERPRRVDEMPRDAERAVRANIRGSAQGRARVIELAAWEIALAVTFGRVLACCALRPGTSVVRHMVRAVGLPEW